MTYLNQTFSRTAASSGEEDLTAAASAMVNDMITALTAADSNITALTGSERGIKVNNIIKIPFANSFVSSSKTVVFKGRNGETDLFQFQIGCQVGSSGESVKQFKINVHMAICDNAFCLTIKNAKTTGDYFTAQILLVTTSNGISAIGYNTTNTTNASAAKPFASASTFYDLRNNSQSLTLVHRLPYSHAATNATIATLTNKVLLSGDSRVGDVPIVDSSNLVGDATYPYGSTTYYAADSNTLIPVGV